MQATDASYRLGSDGLQTKTKIILYNKLGICKNNKHGKA